jgi:hypothetical protein
VKVAKERLDIGWGIEHFQDVYILDFGKDLVDFLSEEDKKDATKNIIDINKSEEILKYVDIFKNAEVDVDNHLLFIKKNGENLYFRAGGIVYECLKNLEKLKVEFADFTNSARTGFCSYRYKYLR